MSLLRKTDLPEIFRMMLATQRFESIFQDLGVKTGTNKTLNQQRVINCGN